MRINVTEATTTFPCPVNKLKGRLLDNLGMEWHTDHGEFTITNQTVNWIMKNVKTSKTKYPLNASLGLFISVQGKKKGLWSS